MKVFRNEVKYLIDKQGAYSLSRLLTDYMIVDKNQRTNNTYYIRSLYFDTIDNESYYEKIDGCLSRKKIRLRIYDIDTNTVKLEIKNKYDNYTYKESMNLSKNEAQQLINGEKNMLLEHNNTTANKVYIMMNNKIYYPKILIDYDREAYTLPFENIRITIDKNIRASCCTDIFKKDELMVQVLQDEIFVLEVKYDHMIPQHILDFLSYYVLEKTAISKYCLSRELLG